MAYPVTRPRRLRASPWIRRLVRETRPSPDDLVWALVISDRVADREPVASMPGVDRLSIKAAAAAAREARDLGIPAVALFPHVDPAKKDVVGSEALRADNLVAQAIRAMKDAAPEVGVVADVALDPFTDHGHDGVLRDGIILNDETVERLAEAAVVLAEAGADIVAPSDMMDGRVGAIRAAMDAAGRTDVAILSYAAKYASAFYGPYRDAIGTAKALQGDKATYQMDPCNAEEALREVALDLEEGADMVMVKPGLPYLDILRAVSETFAVPTFAFQVSGEYAMLMAAAQNGWLEEDRAILETLCCFKRAGAAGVLTYFAPRLAMRLG
jgi:porphobilinogen synthase